MKVLGAKVSEAVFESFEQEAELLRILINRFLEIKCKKRQEKEGVGS